MIRSDLDFILAQIKIAEADARGEPVLGTLIPNPELPWGLRRVDGSNNNLYQGQDGFGAADNPFPRGTDPTYTTGSGSLAFGPPNPAFPGDPANGEKIFKKCKACHVIDEKKNRLGPHLIGIVGRTSASRMQIWPNKFGILPEYTEVTVDMGEIQHALDSGVVSLHSKVKARFKGVDEKQQPDHQGDRHDARGACCCPRSSRAIPRFPSACSIAC
ncbi:MAG: c-type cytochrome, partial [Sphingomonadales bacterium]|nr:c-type cytochrome [Sphingomonadales bacterium]